MVRRRLTTSSTTDQFFTAGLAASMRLRLSCSCSWSGELADNERNGPAKAVSFSCLSNSRNGTRYYRCRVSGATGANDLTKDQDNRKRPPRDQKRPLWQGPAA